MIDVLKAVTKKEVQKQGAKSWVQRPMIEKEFESMHKLLRESDNDWQTTDNDWQTTAHASLWKWYGIRAVVNFQFHMICS